MTVTPRKPKRFSGGLLVLVFLILLFSLSIFAYIESGGSNHIPIEGNGEVGAPTKVSLKPNAISMNLGGIKEGSFSIEWNTLNSIQINRIRILNDIDSLSFTFQDLPNPIVLSAEEDGKTIKDVKFIVTAPKNECAQIITTNCVERKRYDVIVEVQFFHLNSLFLDVITIPIDLSVGIINFSFITIIGAGGLVALCHTRQLLEELENHANTPKILKNPKDLT